MLRTLAGLVAELRAVGIPVSPTEHIDAAAALTHTAVEDREAVRSALATTLVKDAGHRQAFDLVFDLYFAGRRAAAPTAADGDGDGDGDGAADQSLLLTMDKEELAALLERALREGDEFLQRAIAAALVSRFAGFEPGRRVAGTYYAYQSLRPVDRVLSTMDQQRAEKFRSEVQAEIRQRMVDDRGPDDVARTLRHPLPEDVDFLHATRAEITQIREAIRPLARKLAARLARKHRSHKAAPLDFRRTMRHALSTGGVPVELAFRKPHPARPELVVIADISGSVATFASFTLQLTYALRSEFARVRCFVFVDGIAEVTELMQRSDDVAAVTRELNRGTSAVWLSGHSDYGNALRTFVRKWGDQVKSRSTVLVLGDARNNYLHPRDEALAFIAARARHLYWLNPERRSLWDDGDSIIGTYAKHCTEVVECRGLRQLRDFVDLL